MSLTARLLHVCLRELPDAVGDDARAAARRCLVDSLACAYAALGEPPIDALRALHAEGAPSGPSVVIGTGERVRPADAALINGTMVSLQLFDDNQVEMRGHPSAPLWPAVLALGEACDLPLARALDAFVVGYELECRLGPLLNPAHYEHGWHATATQGVLAAAVASAMILGLDEERTAHALGIAASSAGGLRRNFGTMTMSLHSGLAASSGVRAALLAQRGFTADPRILDAPRGYGEVFCAEWSAEALAADLPRWGRPFVIERPGPTFKLYPCGRPTLFGVDAALALRERHGLRAPDVAAAVCDVSYMYPRTVIHSRPVDGLQAKTSLEYCVAATLLDGRPTLATFTDAAVARPELRELLDRVTMRVPPELSEAVPEVRRAPFAQPVTLTVTTRDGRELRETVHHHRGEPDNPASDADLREKFVGCAGRHLGGTAIAAVLDETLRPQATVRSLTARLATAGGRG